MEPDYKPDDHDGTRVTDWLVFAWIVTMLLCIIIFLLGGGMGL